MNQIYSIDEPFLAGEHVPSGLYRDVESGPEVQLEKDGRLSASLDGRIAAYVSFEYTWMQHQHLSRSTDD